jgi:hypothetical protein
MAGIKYYPLARIKTGLYTKGDLYTLDGKPYTGAYYLTYRGDAYTGTNPLTGGNELLSVKPPPARVNQGVSTTVTQYNQIANNPVSNQQQAAATSNNPATLKQIVPYYPIVLPSDYQRGYFTRYFAKRIADKGYIMEVSKEDWNMIKTGSDITYQDYEIEDMLWQLTGPLKDTRVSQYQIKGGVETTNKRVTEQKARNFIGLVEFIGGDYTKFAKITS